MPNVVNVPQISINKTRHHELYSALLDNVQSYIIESLIDSLFHKPQVIKDLEITV